MESLYRYDSVPEVLKALLNKGRRPMSIRQLSQKLGYASDRTVGMVAKGQREMGADMLRRVADYAQLSSRDREFLSLLSLREKYLKLGKSPATIARKIDEFRSKRVRERTVEAAELKGTTRWYAWAVVELLRFFDKPAKAEDVFRLLRGTVKLSELKDTLASLAALGFIGTDKDGFFRALNQDEYVGTSADIPSHTVRTIHREQLLRAIDTLEEQSVSEREFIAKTILISASKIPLLKKRIREVVEDLATEFIAAGAEDAVAVQMNLQFYQQSRSRTAKKS